MSDNYSVSDYKQTVQLTDWPLLRTEHSRQHQPADWGRCFVSNFSEAFCFQCHFNRTNNDSMSGVVTNFNKKILLKKNCLLMSAVMILFSFDCFDYLIVSVMKGDPISSFDATEPKA